jgi:hypothetical protein
MSHPRNSHLLPGSQKAPTADLGLMVARVVVARVVVARVVGLRKSRQTIPSPIPNPRGSGLESRPLVITLTGAPLPFSKGYCYTIVRANSDVLVHT